MIIGRDSARLRSNTGQGRTALVSAAVMIADPVYSLVIIVKYVAADRVARGSVTCKLSSRWTCRTLAYVLFARFHEDDESLNLCDSVCRMDN